MIHLSLALRPPPVKEFTESEQFYRQTLFANLRLAIKTNRELVLSRRGAQVLETASEAIVRRSGLDPDEGHRIVAQSHFGKLFFKWDSPDDLSSIGYQLNNGLMIGPGHPKVKNPTPDQVKCLLLSAMDDGFFECEQESGYIVSLDGYAATMETAVVREVVARDWPFKLSGVMHFEPEATMFDSVVVFSLKVEVLGQDHSLMRSYHSSASRLWCL